VVAGSLFSTYTYSAELEKKLYSSNDTTMLETEAFSTFFHCGIELVFEGNTPRKS
jgi:hypothetical protein